MSYISELLDNKVYDSSDAVVGKLEDILITPKDGKFEPLEFLVIRTPAKKIKFVPYDFVANFNSSEISLKNLFNKIALDVLPSGRNYIYLRKEILDRQIVDVAGTRVVRVDDLRIGVVENKMSVLAIDRSFRAILRRLGLDWLFFGGIFPVKLIDWRHAKFLEGKAPLKLNTAADALGQLHPADLANIVEELDVKSGSSFLESLSSEDAAKVLEEVDPQLQTILVKHLGPDRAGKILSQMSSDEFADLVKTFSDHEAREILEKVGGGRAQSVQKLISYEDDTAGGLMTLDFFTARPDWTVEKTIEELRKVSNKMRSIVHIYVAGEDGKFLGAVSLRRMLLADRQALISKMAKGFPAHSTLKPGDKIPKVIKLMTKYNLYTAAVIDKDKKLAGVVTIDDVMRLLAPRA